MVAQARYVGSDLNLAIRLGDYYKESELKRNETLDLFILLY